MSIYRTNLDTYRVECDECHSLLEWHYNSPEEAQEELLKEGWVDHPKGNDMHLCIDCYRNDYTNE